MLHEFLTANRLELIARCRSRVAQPHSPSVPAAAIESGVPRFLDQLAKTLEVEQTADPMRSRKVSGPAGGGMPALSEIGEAAASHGRDLLKGGFTVEQLVHEYGNVCQAITNLALEQNYPIDVDEFRTLNRCLDNAIAVAVTEFNYQRDSVLADRHVEDWNHKLGFFAHELRNFLNTATLALSAVRAGDVGVGGATGAILDRSLVGMRSLIDRSLTDVRIAAGLPLRHGLFSLADFIAEVRLSAALEAQLKESKLTVSAVDPALFVDGDRDLLLSAVGNLLQNAFKFTHPHTEVTLNAYANADRVLIEVADHCGGLPPGGADRMFRPFTQLGEDKSGLGLGLSIAQRSVAANDGTLSVRDVPGHGCVFTVDLPRRTGQR